MKNILSNLCSSSRTDRVRTLAIDSVSIASRYRVLGITMLCLLTIGVGNVWGATATLSASCFENNVSNYSTSEASITDENSNTWKIKGYGMVKNTSVTIGKAGANYLQTPSFGENITKIVVTCSGSYYLKVIDNSGTQVCAQQAASGGTLTFDVSGSYKQLKLYSKRASSETSNAATTITNVVVTYGSSCSTEPTVGSSLTSVSATANSITATVPISAIGGCDITENGLVYSTSNSTPTVGGTNCTKVTTTACGSTAANKTVEITGLTCGQGYYVRGYATNAAGTSYTNVTSQSTSACPKYTVTLKDDETELTQASAGASVTLPSRTGCTGYTFAGWTKTWVAPQSSWTTTAPTIIPAGSYTPSANENLYPVYTKTEGGGTAFDSYEKVTSAPDDWTAHKYVIATADNGVVLTGYAANYYGGYTTMSTSTEMASYEITVTEVSAGIYKLYQNSKYLALNANENRLYFLDSYTGSDGTNNKCDWKFYNYSGGYIVESPLTYTISKKSGCYRAIQYNNTSGQERFACYKHNTQTIAYLYMRKETSGSTTYYISVPNCCDKNVTLAHNSPSNGTVTFSPAGPIATCSATAADRQTTMTITPNAGYKLTGWSTTGVTPASVSPAVATSGDDSKSAQAITVTFTQNTTTGTYTANATFTAMVDHYIDKLHADINTLYDGDGKAFNTAGYSVPSLSNGGDPADDSCAEAHYKFVGWIDEAYVDTDGTLTDASKMFTATGTKNPSDTNFIAVWAKEK